MENQETSPYWYTCLRCNKENTAKYWDIPCRSCLSDPEYIKEEKLKENNVKPYGPSFHQHVDVTAIGTDKRTGQTVGLDSKGRKVDIERTRYKDLKRDPHGWKSVGLSNQYER